MRPAKIIITNIVLVDGDKYTGPVCQLCFRFSLLPHGVEKEGNSILVSIHTNTPVIIISGLDDDVQVARRIGPMAEVRKPIDVDALLEQVALYCERTKL